MGRRIGRYEILELIGQGGFGQVFRAFDPTFGRQVAIKTITAAGDLDLIQRFRNEAAAAGRLRHQNIVIVYDFGEDEGQPFLVMELLDGDDLDRVLRQENKLTLLQKLDVVSQAAAGLYQAHSAGIVHRDVKPANIMLQHDGVVKIMDFGIALLSQATAARLTVTGEIPGTVSYMAPEQLTSGGVSDALTDIWGFGVTCYKLLTGIHPFTADTVGATVYKIVNSNPEPIRALNPECPEALEQAIMRLMSRDREARYQSLEELRFDLEPVIADLRRERVDELLATARTMMAENRLQAVQRVLRTVLDSDPANRTARDLRDEVQRKIRENEIRPRVASLLQQGIVEMQARRFEEASKKFESALRLENSNAEARRFLASAQAARERLAQADELAGRAEKLLAGGDLTAARSSIADALSADPENAKAARLDQEVRELIRSRDRERRLEEELSQARRLIVLESFGEAASQLERVVAEYPESRIAQELLDKARTEGRKQEQRLRLQRLTDDAKARIKAERFAEALEGLKAARTEFPDAPELRDLERFAAEEDAAQRMAKAISKAVADAQELARTLQFESALTLLRGALAEFSGAAPLRDAMHAIDAARGQYERHETLREAEAQAQMLIREGRFAEAAQKIEIFTRAYGTVPELESLRKQADQALERQRREAAAGNLAANARSLLEEGKAEHATQMLRDATAQFPDQKNLVQLLAEAERKLEQQRAAEVISRIISEAESLSRSRQFERALATLDEGLQRYPNAERLERCRRATLAVQARRREEEREQNARERAERLRHAGDIDQALAEIDAVLLDGGEYSKLRELRNDIDRERATRTEATRQIQEREQALRDLKARVTKLREAGQFAAALEAIIAAPDSVTSDPELAGMRRELEQLQAAARSEDSFRQLVGRAGELLRTRRAAEVIALLEGAKEFAGRPAVADLLARAREQIADEERERALDSAESVIRQMARAGQFDQALHALTVALARYPGSDRLADLRRSIVSAQDRANALTRITAEAEALLRAGKIAEALSLLTDFEAKYGGEKRIGELKREAELRGIEMDAEGLLADGRPEDAIALIERRSPGDRRFEELRNRAREQSNAQRRRAAAEQARRQLLEIEAGVAATPRRKLNSIATEARRLAAVHADDASLADLASRIEDRVKAALAIHPAGPALPKLWIAAAALVFAAAAGAILWWTTSGRSHAKPASASLFPLNVRTDPEGTPVRVAGQSCANPACRFYLASGAYVLHAERQGYSPAEETVRVGPGTENGLVTITLKPQAPPVPPKGAQTGVLSVSTTPGARVTIDNVPHGVSDAQGEFSESVQAGRHDIDVEKAGYTAAARHSLSITEGRTEHVRIELAPKLGKVAIEGAPAGAKIRLGAGAESETDGRGTFVLSASPGQWPLRVSNANGARETMVRIEPGGTSALEWSAIAPAPRVSAPPAATAKLTVPPTATPAATPAATPEQRELQDWQVAQKNSDPAQVQAFLRDHPGSRFESEAKSLLENLSWTRTYKDSVQSLHAYLAAFPEGAHATDAQTALKRLTAPPPAPSSPPPSTQPQPSLVSAADIQGLKEAIERFNNAFLHKNSKELKQIWPSAPPEWENPFQKGAMVVASLDPQGKPDVSGNSATWRCTMMLAIFLRGQAQPNQSKNERVQFQRRGDGSWVISDMKQF